MEQIKLGIDNGNYHTKSSDHMLYASGFAAADTEFIVPDMQLCYQGRYYAIGDRPMSFQQEKYKTDDTFVLSLPAMANAMKRAHVQEAEFILGVGLPIGLCGTQKAAFRDYFLREPQAFVYEEQAYTVIIRDCQVFPQGFAALCNCYEQLRDCQSVSIVDIGGYTVDVMTVTNNRPVKSSCLSIQKGTILLFNEIRALLEQHNINLSDELIDLAVQGKIQHVERDMILSIAEEQVQAYMKDLLNALREYGLDLRLPVAFAGGGAELLGKRLVASDVNIVTTLGRFANADGYKVLIRE